MHPCYVSIQKSPAHINIFIDLEWIGKDKYKHSYQTKIWLL